MYKGFLVWIVIVAGGATPSPVMADCLVHEVVAGDTLGAIATQHLGRREAAGLIYDANRDVIGPDPDIIEKGQRLEIPCAPAAVPEPVAAVVESSPPPVLPGPRPVVLLTGGPFDPFAGPMLPGGGMITELINAAFDAQPGPRVTVAFVNDRDAHLGTILPRGGFDLAAPWVFPECASDTLTAAEVELCSTFVASDGFYEFVAEFYARADSAWANVILPSAMAGARFCRPAGYPVADLAEMVLPPPGLTLIRAPDPATCLQMLDRGEADIASMDAAVTRALIDRVSIENPLVVLESLTNVHRLRVLAPKTGPGAQKLIDRLNAGLETISTDGTWFEIVSRHLRDPGS